MKIRALLSLGLALVLAVGAIPVDAQTTVWAKPRDVRVLRDEIVSLDATLEDLGRRQPPHAESMTFNRRADDLRDDVQALSDRVRNRDRASGPTGVALDDVQRLRAEIVDLRMDIETALDLRYSGDRAVLPSGTEVFIRLDQTISSKTARPEDRVTATVVEPVRLDGRTVIPVGTEVTGVVRAVDTADRLARGGKLELAFDGIRLDTRRIDMRTRVMEVKGEGLERNSSTERKAGLGAIIGGVIGGITEGTTGAVVGAILGAGGGIAASKGQDVVLPEGTIMTLRLDDAMTVAR